PEKLLILLLSDLHDLPGARDHPYANEHGREVLQLLSCTVSSGGYGTSNCLYIHIAGIMHGQSVSEEVLPCLLDRHPGQDHRLALFHVYGFNALEMLQGKKYVVSLHQRG